MARATAFELAPLARAALSLRKMEAAATSGLRLMEGFADSRRRDCPPSVALRRRFRRWLRLPRYRLATRRPSPR